MIYLRDTAEERDLPGVDAYLLLICFEEAQRRFFASESNQQLMRELAARGD